MVCFLSTCIYPDKVKYPITEDQLHNGLPHPSNEGYAMAKRMLESQCRLYNESSGTSYLCIAPTNLFGQHDQYREESSHVLPALIRKAHEVSLGKSS